MTDKFVLVLAIEKTVDANISEYIEQVELGEFDTEEAARATLEEILEVAEVEVEDEE